MRWAARQPELRRRQDHHAALRPAQRAELGQAWPSLRDHRPLGHHRYKRDAFGRVDRQEPDAWPTAMLAAGALRLHRGRPARRASPTRTAPGSSTCTTPPAASSSWTGTACRWSPASPGTRWASPPAGAGPSPTHEGPACRQPQLRHRGTADRRPSSQLRLRRGRTHQQPDAAAVQAGRCQPADSAVASANGTWNVGYDAVGRISSFGNGNGNGSNSASFGYDANGNRLPARADASEPDHQPQLHGERATGSRVSARPPAAPRPASATRYNANGDMTGDGLRRYSYNAEGRLSCGDHRCKRQRARPRATRTTRLGQRVFKTEPLYPPVQGEKAIQASCKASSASLPSCGGQAPPMQSSWAMLSCMTRLARCSGSTARAGPTARQHPVHLPAHGQRADADHGVSGGRKYAVHADHLNTPRRLTQGNGRVVWQWGYSAFGDEEPDHGGQALHQRVHDAHDRTTNMAPMSPSTSATGACTSDQESGLFYNYFRSYCPSCGRYEPDPIGLNGGWNKYSYALATRLNLLTRRDLTGYTTKDRGNCLISHRKPPAVALLNRLEMVIPAMALVLMIPHSNHSQHRTYSNRYI